MIRQAISCDICGNEKRQTNHWFVAYDQGGELRVSGWSSRNRLRPGSKHLCGQTCLHKLVDEYVAKALTARAAQTATDDIQSEVLEQSAHADTSLTSSAAYDEGEPSAKLIAQPKRVAPAKPTETPAAAARPPLRAAMELIVVPARARAEESVPPVVEPPRFASRNWRAEAWERERERELRAGERHPGMARRRFSS